MREIKFRLWDNEIEQMSNDVSIFANGFRKAVFNSGEERVYNLPTIEWIKLMQFTGLHDKNGKEIYEGDILHVYEVRENRFNEPKEKITEYVSPVFWEDYGWVVDESETVQVPLVVLDKSKDFIGTVNEIEVIGNIYEHKHLLEG